METQRVIPKKKTKTVKVTRKITIEYIQPWIDFLTKEKIIRIDKEKKESSEVETNPFLKDFYFVVIFPKSFQHINDFKGGLKVAQAKAFFMKDGSVYLLYIRSGNELHQHQSYFGGWKNILLRSTGRELKVLLSLDLKNGRHYVNELLFKKLKFK